MAINPPSQYADDSNLRTRQHLWELQDPPFDLVGWVLDLAGVDATGRVLDVGCGNGAYLRGLRARGVEAIGCDLSLGMLAVARSHRPVANAEAAALPFRAGSFDVVLAPHTLYHVLDRTSAVRELRRVLASEGVCVAVTNGAAHLRAVKTFVETAVRTAHPGWEMRGQLSAAFSLENGIDQLRVGFDDVACVRPSDVGAVVVHDAQVVADYVASVGDHYEPDVDLPWDDVVAFVHDEVQPVSTPTGRSSCTATPARSSAADPPRRGRVGIAAV
jgi:SAM-dependent methyltransferase